MTQSPADGPRGQHLRLAKVGNWVLPGALNSKLAATGPMDQVKPTMAGWMRQGDFGNLDQVPLDPPSPAELEQRLAQGKYI